MTQIKTLKRKPGTPSELVCENLQYRKYTHSQTGLYRGVSNCDVICLTELANIYKEFPQAEGYHGKNPPETFDPPKSINLHLSNIKRKDAIMVFITDVSFEYEEYEDYVDIEWAPGHIDEDKLDLERRSLYAGLSYFINNHYVIKHGETYRLWFWVTINE